MSIDIIKPLLGLCASFFTTLWTVPRLIKIAHKFKILDIPDGSIKKHKEPTAYLGGVAVYLGFIVGIGIVIPLENTALLFFIGTTLALLVGLTDDLVPLTPLQKFLGQVLAALCFMRSCDHTLFLLGAGFWIVTSMNAFNLIDVMDGLATLVAFCATATFFLSALMWQQGCLALLLATFLGALGAFFIYNRPPAKIYLGDAGSLLIGGVLGAVSCMFNGAPHVSRFQAVAVSVLVMAIPLLELVTLIIIRTAKKIPFYKASPDHFSLYLLRAGWSKQAVLRYVACQYLYLGVVALLCASNVLGSLGVLLACSLFLCSWVFVFMQQNLLRK